jgi:hypothetical protein
MASRDRNASRIALSKSHAERERTPVDLSGLFQDIDDYQHLRAGRCNMSQTASVSMHNLVMGLAVMGAAIVAAFPAVAGTPRYKLDPSGRKVIYLSNLSDADDCFPSKLKGKVAKRTFDARGINLEGLVIEEPDGSRNFINGNSNYGEDAVTMGTVKRGLETLLKVGRRIEVGIYACGAAGRVQKLNSVRALD